MATIPGAEVAFTTKDGPAYAMRVIDILGDQAYFSGVGYLAYGIIQRPDEVYIGQLVTITEKTFHRVRY